MHVPDGLWLTNMSTTLSFSFPLPSSFAFSSHISWAPLLYTDLLKNKKHMARLFDLSAAFQPSTSQSGYSRWHFWEIFRPQDSPVFLMLLRPNSKVGYGITEEAKLDRQSDRKTNESSLVFRHCSLFLNLAQMLRFKTKLVAVIFSQPFLKRCHVVGVEVRVCESVRMCVFVRCVKWVLYRVFAGVYVQVPICGEAEGFTECVHACVCVHLIGELGGWVRV